MSWNLCVTTMLVVVVFKTETLCGRHQILTKIREKLHYHAEMRQQSGDTTFNNLALKELKVMQGMFYMTIVMFCPAWVLSRYFVHKDLPIPFEVPPTVDLTDRGVYLLMFFIFTLAGVLGLTVAAELQLAMFGILIQISREYRVLLNDIPKLDELYDSPEEGEERMEKTVRLEVNPWLKKRRTKELLKEFSCRLEELIECTKSFEYCYNESFFMEVFAASLIIITLAFQSLVGSVDLSGDFFSQTGYLSIVVFDMFASCMYATRIQTQCSEVGVAIYSTKWYRMATDVQKDISFLILRSQKPPKITAAKLMELNLTVFMQRMSNIFSCLAVLRQFEFKAQKVSLRI